MEGHLPPMPPGSAASDDTVSKDTTLTSPKRAKSATKSDDESNSNDCPSHQQSTDELSDLCDEPQEVINPL